MSQKPHNNKGSSFRRGVAIAALSFMFAGTLPNAALANPNAPRILDLDHDTEQSSLSGSVSSPGATIIITYADGTIYESVEADENGFFEVFIPEDVDVNQLSIWIHDREGGSTYRDNVNPSEDYTVPVILNEQIILHADTIANNPAILNASEASYLIVLKNGEVIYDSEDAGVPASEEHVITLETLGGEFDENGFYALQLKDPDGNYSTELEAVVLGQIDYDLALLEEDAEGNPVIPYYGQYTSIAASAPSGTVITYQASWMNESLIHTVPGSAAAPTTEFFEIELPDVPPWDSSLNVSVTAVLPNGETVQNTYPVVESSYVALAPLPDLINVPENAIRISGSSALGSRIQMLINGTAVEAYSAVTGTDGRFAISLEEIDIQEGDVITLVMVDTSAEMSSDPSMPINVGAASGVTTGPDTPNIMHVTMDAAYIDVSDNEESVIYHFYDAEQRLIYTSLLSNAENGVLPLPGVFNDGQTVYFSARNAEGYESALLEHVVDLVGPPVIALDEQSIDPTNPIVSGTSEPDASVVLTYGEGDTFRVIAAGYADDEGRFSIEVPSDDPLLESLLPFEVRSSGQYGDAAPVMVQFSNFYAEYDAPEVPEFFEGTLNGTTEPGLTVIVYDNDGNEIDSTVADDDGNFTFDLSGYPEMTVFNVLGVDEHDNQTPYAQTISADVTAPTGTVGNVGAGQRYVDIEVEADPSGVNITVIGPDGETVLDSISGLMTDRLWSAELPGFTEGTVFYVEFSDSAGNTTRVEVTVGSQEEFSMRVQVPSAQAGDTAISGTVLGGEGVRAFATVNNGEQLEAEVNEDSQSFTIQLDSPVAPDDTILVWAETEGGMRTETVTVDVIHNQLDAPRVGFISAADTTISGSAQGAVSVRLYGGNSNQLLDEVTVDDEYRFSFEISSLTGGQEFSIVGVDTFGVEGLPAQVTVDEEVSPELTVERLNEGDEFVVGTTSPEAVVTVHDENNTELGRATANQSGQFSVELSRSLVGGDKITVLAILNGVPSDPVTREIGDITPPDAPTFAGEFNNRSKVLTGGAEPNSMVIVSVDGTEAARAKVDANGVFSVEFEDFLDAGSVISIIARDAAGNDSDALEITVTNIVEPNLEVDSIEYGDSQISGTTEAGATVRILTPNRDEVASATASATGTFSVTVPGMELDAEFIVTAQTDGPAAEITVHVRDTTPPELDRDSFGFQHNGKTLVASEGATEPGVTVFAYAPGQDAPIARGIADDDGSFSLEIGDLPVGTLITVTAEDASGNSTSVELPIPPSDGDDDSPVPIPEEEVTPVEEDSTGEDSSDEADTILPDGGTGDDPVYEIDEDGNLIPVNQAAEDLEQTGSDAARVAGIALMMFTAGGVVFALRRRMGEEETA